MALDVGSIQALIEQHGYLIVFLAGLGEGIPLLGIAIPGQAIILLAGAVSATDTLSLPLVILVAIPAGILGDALGYYAGRWYGRGLVERHGPRLGFKAQHLERSDALFAKYGAFALVFARFSFLTRGVGPLLAGTSKMRARVFWPVNVLGAVAWAVAYTTLGYAFGASWLLIEGAVGRILAVTLLGVVGIYALYRILRKYAQHFTREDLYIALLASVGGAIFGVLADRLHRLGRANALDVGRDAFVAAAEPARGAAEFVAMGMSYPVLGLVSLLMFGAFALRRRVWEATLVGMGVGGSILVVEALRVILEAPLRAGHFPSASAAVPLVLGGVVTYLVAFHSRRPLVVYLTLMGMATLAAAGALSRLVLGQDAPTDVAGGFAIGTAWLAVTILIVEFGVKRETP